MLLLIAKSIVFYCIKYVEITVSSLDAVAAQCLKLKLNSKCCREVFVLVSVAALLITMIEINLLRRCLDLV